MPAASIMNTGNFNSQPHKEADVTKSKFYPAIAYFNSQPHKEADNNRIRIWTTYLYFNSQPHKEADL